MARRHRARAAGQAVYDRGDLVPDDLMIDAHPRPADRGRRERGFVLDGFPRTSRRPRRSTRCSSELDRALDVVLEFQLRDEVALERLVQRRAEEGRADDTPEAIRTGSRSTTSRRSRSSSTTARAGILVGIHADRPIDEVFARDPAGARAGGGRDDHPQVPAEIEQMARAGAVVAETLALIGEHIAPGHHDRRSSTARGASSSARKEACRRSRATAATRRRSARRRTRWSSTASRARTRSREGDLLSVDVGVTLDGFVGDSAYTFPSARSRPMRSGCSTSARQRSPPGSSRPRRQPALGHLARRSARDRGRTASRSSAASSATASGGRCTRTRRSRTSASPAAVRCSQPGMTLAIEPMINAGGAGGRPARRRMVDLDRRRARFPRTSSTPSRSPMTDRGS